MNTPSLKPMTLEEAHFDKDCTFYQMTDISVYSCEHDHILIDKMEYVPIEKYTAEVNHWKGGYNACQDVIKELSAENERLKEEFMTFKKGIAKGKELYAHLKFDNEEFTPYQLALQKVEDQQAEIDRLKDQNQKLMSEIGELLAGDQHENRINRRPSDKA
jgi:chromosome segregation ATPase